MITSASDIIDRFGGASALAERLKTSPSRVGNWKTRGRIPPELFLVIRDEAARDGFEVAPAAFGMETTS